jgi:hypothetical protein
VLLAVPPLVGGRIGQPEVRPEVDHLAGAGQKLAHQAHRCPVGQPAEHEVDVVDQVGLVRDEGEVAVGGGEGRVELGHPGAGLRGAGGEGHFEVGMAGQEAHQLGAGEAGRADDAHPQWRCGWGRCAA